MFYDARSFNQDLSSWNVSLVTNAERIFDGSTLFDISTICGWSNGWRELCGCGGQPHQCFSPSIRFGLGLHAVFLMLFVVFAFSICAVGFASFSMVLSD